MGRALATHHGHDAISESTGTTLTERLIQSPRLVFRTAAVEVLVHPHPHALEHGAFSLGRHSDVEIGPAHDLVYDVGAICAFFTVHTHIITEMAIFGQPPPKTGG